jgi:hypothetical protein
MPLLQKMYYREDNGEVEEYELWEVDAQQALRSDPTRWFEENPSGIDLPALPRSSDGFVSQENKKTAKV